jgi:ankyrin repeat protein
METPLSLAGENGQDTVVKLLLEKGASPEPRDEAGKNGHVVCSRIGNATLIQVCSLNQQSVCHLRISHGMRALLFAAGKGT